MRPSCTRRTKSAATVFLNHHHHRSSGSSSHHCFMNSIGSGPAASSSSLAAARCASSELKNSRKFRTAMHSSLYQSNRLCGVPSIGRKTRAMSTFAGTTHSSKEQDERPIQVQPHVLSAYALNVNPNFELNVSTVARIDAKDFPSEEEVRRRKNLDIPKRALRRSRYIKRRWT